ncbi:MAG: hypothetical protein AB8G96_06085 [Phycisphaerales bacterium]
MKRPKTTLRSWPAVLGLIGTMLVAGGPVAGQAPSFTRDVGAETGIERPLAPASRPGPASTLASRIIRVFEFEDAVDAPIFYPSHWQNLATTLGRPAFGTALLENDHAYSGAWSFRFSPDGVSLASGVPSGVILVHPLTDYRVRCRVRTEGLTHARARLSAALFDAAGNIIPGSRTESPGVQSPDRWSMLEVTVEGHHPEAVSLAVELHLDQPGPPANATNEQLAIGDPVLADVSGHAWFDEVVVEHRSRAEIAINGVANVVTAPATPRLAATVFDLTTAGLTARLSVFDAAGAMVHRQVVEQVRGREQMLIDLPVPRFGWYRAQLDIVADGNPSGSRELTFAWVPPLRRPSAMPEQRFGFLVPNSVRVAAADIPAFIDLLAADAASMPVWPPGRPDQPEVWAAINELLDRDVRLLMEFRSLHPDTAAQLSRDPGQVIEGLAGDPLVWDPDLEPLIIEFGLRATRWLLGAARPTDHNGAAIDAPLPIGADVARARANLIAELPAGIFGLPVDAIDALAARGNADELLIRIPDAASPESIGDWIGPDRSLVHLARPPGLDARDAEIDLALRILNAWRADAQTVLVDAPWRSPRETESGPWLDPVVPALRRMGDALTARTFAGELRFGEHVRAWMLRGRDSNDHALVVWTEGRSGDAPTELAIRLGRNRIESIDLRGNGSPVATDETGRHVFHVGPSPRFIRGVDLELLRFRAALRIDPGTIPAIYRAHEVELVISNPWPVAISGLVAFDEGDERRIRPLRHPFTLQPGETRRRPVTIVFDRGAVAGEHIVPTTVTVEAVDTDRFAVDLPIRVGWKDVELSATWLVTPNAETGEQDLIVRQFVTNRGTEAVQLDAFIRGPGLGRQQRPLERLAPGATGVRTFRIPAGADILAGRTLRYGVIERNGSAQLNMDLELPWFGGTITATVPTDGDG